MNDTSVKSQLWHLIDQRRSKGQYIELIELLQVAINQGYSITLNDLRDYVDNSHDRTVYLLPEFISNFITAYLKDNPTAEKLESQ